MITIALKMMLKLLQRANYYERQIAQEIALTMSHATQLPPFIYKGNITVPVNNNPYIWSRNLLANRLYICPVIYIESYVMNSNEVFQRIQNR